MPADALKPDRPTIGRQGTAKLTLSSSIVSWCLQFRKEDVTLVDLVEFAQSKLQTCVSTTDLQSLGGSAAFADASTKRGSKRQRIQRSTSVGSRTPDITSMCDPQTFASFAELCGLLLDLPHRLSQVPNDPQLQELASHFLSDDNSGLEQFSQYVALRLAGSADTHGLWVTGHSFRPSSLAQRRVTLRRGICCRPLFEYSQTQQQPVLGTRLCLRSRFT